MKKFKDILNKIEVIIYLIILIKAVPLHFFIPYNFLFFLFDVTFVFSIFSDCFFIGKFEKNPNFTIEKYSLFYLRIWGILGIIILAKYTDFFESIFSKVFG